MSFGRCNPLAHITSLPMNGLLLIITRPPSTIMHCIPCVRSFEHLLVIKINFSAKQSTKISLFKIKNLKFWRRGHCPLPQRDRGGSSPNPTYSARASIRTSWLPTALDPLAVFEQFEHWLDENENLQYRPTCSRYCSLGPMSNCYCIAKITHKLQREHEFVVLTHSRWN